MAVWRIRTREGTRPTPKRRIACHGRLAGSLKNGVRVGLALAGVSILAGFLWPMPGFRPEQTGEPAESMGSKPSITQRLILIETRLDAVQREAWRLYRLLVEAKTDAHSLSRTQSINLDLVKKADRRDDTQEDAQR